MKRRCKVDCISWFSTYQDAFKGMDCYKPDAGHCMRNIYDQCSEKFEYYTPKTKRKMNLLKSILAGLWAGCKCLWWPERKE